MVAEGRVWGLCQWRELMYSKLTKKYGTRLVRINPEAPWCAKEAAATIAVQDGCLDALRKIDAKMKEACGRADAV